MTQPRPGDLKAGLMGLLIAVIFLGAALYGIVYLTNQKFASHTVPATGQSH